MFGKKTLWIVVERVYREQIASEVCGRNQCHSCYKSLVKDSRSVLRIKAKTCSKEISFALLDCKEYNIRITTDNRYSDHVNEPSGSRIFGEFRGQKSNYYVLKKNCTS